jgi:hypothetical protein
MKIKLQQILICFCFSGIAINVNCQEDIENKKIDNPLFGIIAGSNYSWYKNSVGEYNLNNLEFYIGSSNKFKIKNSFDANISFYGGLKKGETYKQRSLNGDMENFEYVLFEVDRFDKLFSHNYYFLEIPIAVGYNIFKMIDLSIGYSVKYYFPQKNQEEYSFIFNNKFENGILCGVSIHLSERFLLNGNFVFATKNSFSSMIITPGREYVSTLKRREFQLNLQYFFK